MNDTTHKFDFANSASTMAVDDAAVTSQTILDAAAQGGELVHTLFSTDLSALKNLYQVIKMGGPSVWEDGTDLRTGLSTSYVQNGDALLLVGVYLLDEATGQLKQGSSSFETVGFAFLTLVTGAGSEKEKTSQIMTFAVRYAGGGIPHIEAGDAIKNVVEKLVSSAKNFVSKVVELLSESASADSIAAATSQAKDGVREAAKEAESEGEHIAISEESSIIAEVSFSIAEALDIVLSLGELIVSLILLLVSKQITNYVRFYNDTSFPIELSTCWIKSGSDSAASPAIPNSPVTLPGRSPALTPPQVIGNTPTHYLESVFVNSDQLEGVGYVLKADLSDTFPGLNAMVNIPNAGNNSLFVSFGREDQCEGYWEAHKNEQEVLVFSTTHSNLKLTIATNQLAGQSPSPLDGAEGYNYQHIILLQETHA